MAFSRFTLNLSPLDDPTTGWDGSPFPMNGTATTGLGSVSATATSTINNPTSATATLQGISGTAQASISHYGVANSQFGSILASAQANINNETSASSQLGGLNASANYEIDVESVASALLGQLNGTAVATITPVDKPSNQGGAIYYHPNFVKNPKQFQQKPVEKPKPIQELKPVEKLKPVLKPNPSKTIKASASVTVNGVTAKAVGAIYWIAELDDLEVLELL